MNKITGILLLLVSICVGTFLLKSNFALPYNLQNVARYSAFYGILGIGVSFVIMTGGIDLSIGSLIGLTGCLLPMMMVGQGWPPWLAMVVVLSVAAAVGLTHGLLITRIRLQPFIVTLCGLLIYRGIARGMTRDGVQSFGSGFDQSWRLLATGKPCSMATLMCAAGVLLPLLALFRWRVQRGSAHSAAILFQPFPLAVVGLTLLLVGSSRFWQGAEVIASPAFPGWQLRIPPGAEKLPQRMMSLGWIPALAAFAWLLVVAVPRGGKRLVVPLLLTISGGVLVAQVAQKFSGDVTRLKLLAVLGSLAIVTAGAGWFTRSVLKSAGAPVRAPLQLTGFFCGLWLLGQIPLGETLAPAPMLVLIIIALAASVFLNQTIYGRAILALGSNEEAARYSGIPTDRMIILAYVLCSLLAGIASILIALDVNSIQPDAHGNFFELYAIAAAVLGGCSLRGGEGTVLGVVIGAAVLRVLYNAINILGIPSQLEFAVIGGVILCGVLTDELVRRFAARRVQQKPAA